MKRKPLSDYLILIKSALDKQRWNEAKRLGEVAVKKLSRLSYSPEEECFLYYRLGLAYHNLADYSRSLETLHKAQIITLKHALPPAHRVSIHFLRGNNFLIIRSINQALKQLHLVEEYYQKYGTTNPVDEWQYLRALICLGYCYLYKNELEPVRRIIEEKLLTYQSVKPKGYFTIEYNHLKGEYLMALKEFDHARQCFQECIRVSNELNDLIWALEAKTHLATIDLMEGQTDSAIFILQGILKDSRRLKRNDLVCEAGLLLSRCYLRENSPLKAAAVEKLIKPFLAKLDATWLYEKTREFEGLYRQLQTKPMGQPVPAVLVQALNHHYETSPYKEIIIGHSLPMQEVWQLVEKIAPTDLPVLIQGETGTGKELIARALRRNSPRSNQPYLAFNSGAITETLIESELFGHQRGAFTGAIGDKKGYIELASGGTLFIDEIGNMSPAMQTKLLRVLEEKLLWRVGGEKAIPVDTRFVFASNQNLEELVKRKLFREDLFYRINTIVVNLPPLRDRKEDIPLLTRHFLQKYSQSAIRIPQSTLSILAAYPWPGNVRELENEIKRICVLHPDIKCIDEKVISGFIRDHISINSPSETGRAAIKQLTDKFHSHLITEAIEKYNGNINQAAEYLGYSRRGLYKRIHQLKISSKSVAKR